MDSELKYGIYLGLRIVTVILAIALFYVIIAFSNIPIIMSARNLWIETAMSTADHQWLATKFLPKSSIDRAMSERIETPEDFVSDPDFVRQEMEAAKMSDLVTADGGEDEQKENAPSSTMEWVFGPTAAPKTDEFGNSILVYDPVEEILVVEIKALSYTGRLIIVEDPSRVIVRQVGGKKEFGKFVCDYMDEYDAIAGMNGNGFMDPEGHGRGGDIIGWSVSNGTAWGSGQKATYDSVGFTTDDALIVGRIKDFETHAIRDLVQYGPTLIANGKQLLSGSSGWGLQPRSAIGQKEDGTVILATFDGRQPGHSIGITVGEVADILFQYGCVNAGLCDGGSSSVMAYNGDIIGRPSTPMKDTGRYLPNAILILKKEASPAVLDESTETYSTQ